MGKKKEKEEIQFTLLSSCDFSFLLPPVFQGQMCGCKKFEMHINALLRDDL